MICHLSLECIGDGGGLSGQGGGLAALFLGKIPPRAWVARVKYIRGNYVQREFVQGKKDFTNADSIGSRGVMAHYFLSDGLYEVSAPQSWKNTDRYFAYIEDGELWRATREEAILWVNDHLG